MKEIIVVSDNHGKKDFYDILVKRHGKLMMLHLGDIELSEQFINDRSITAVKGNSFYDPNLPEELSLIVNGVKIFMTHGHLYSVKSSRDFLANIAGDAGADIVLYGHTHNALFERINNVICFCPGSTSRSYGKANSYATIEIRDITDFTIYLRELETGDILWKS